MLLTPPTKKTFWTSVIMTAVSLVISIKVIEGAINKEWGSLSGFMFASAYVLLVIGVLKKGV